MKEPFFNDLSANTLCRTDVEVESRISSFVKILEFCGSLGFKHVRYEIPFQDILLKENFTLQEYIRKHGCDNNARLILTMVRKPYLDEDSVAEERYVNSVVRLKKEGTEIEAEGLACAFLAEGFAIGFASEEFWQKNSSFDLKVTNQSNGEEKNERVFCISDVVQFEAQEFIEWAVHNLPLKFKSCGIPKKDKKYHFRDDHGKNVLKTFADKILKEDYIVEVINSLPFNPHADDMIGNISENGLIDLILVDTDKGYGMVIKTTAETRRLAKYLAADIKEKYS